MLSLLFTAFCFNTMTDVFLLQGINKKNRSNTVCNSDMIPNEEFFLKIHEYQVFLLGMPQRHRVITDGKWLYQMIWPTKSSYIWCLSNFWKVIRFILTKSLNKFLLYFLCKLKNVFLQVWSLQEQTPPSHLPLHNLALFLMVLHRPQHSFL